MIANGWVDRADKDKCIWAMANSKAVVKLLDFTNHDLMLSLMRTKPATIKHIQIESIPEDQYDYMLQHMGLSMHPYFWTLATAILNKQVVSNESACEFLRRAIRHVEVSKIIAFL